MSKLLALILTNKEITFLLNSAFFSWLGDFNADNSIANKVNLHFKKISFTFGIKCHVCMFSVFPSSSSHIIWRLAPSKYSVLSLSCRWMCIFKETCLSSVLLFCVLCLRAGNEGVNQAACSIVCSVGGVEARKFIWKIETWVNRLCWKSEYLYTSSDYLCFLQ